LAFVTLRSSLYRSELSNREGNENDPVERFLFYIADVRANEIRRLGVPTKLDDLLLGARLGEDRNCGGQQQNGENPLNCMGMRLVSLYNERC
jgi:hypothetical protein